MKKLLGIFKKLKTQIHKMKKQDKTKGVTMNLFKKISIRTKLLFSFLFILILIGIVGWRGIAGMRHINQELNSIHDNQFIPARLIANANIALIAWNRATLNHVLAENKEKMNEYEQIMLDQRIAIVARLNELSRMKSLSERGKDLVRGVQNDFQQADPIRDRVVALSKRGRQEEARQLIRVELRSIIDNLDKDMTEFLLLQEKQLEQAKKITDARYNQALMRILLIIGSTLILSFFIGFILSNAITKNINKLVQGLKALGAGDFKLAKVNIQSNDELGYLGDGHNQMVDKIEQNIIEIKQIQEDLISQEKLATVGKLSGGIAHELNNPMGVIVSSAYYLKMKLKETDEKILQHIDRIMSQANISTNIIKSMQNLTKLQEPQKVRIDLADAVEDAIAYAKPPQSVKLIQEVPENHFLVDADKQQLVILFNNIVTNAIQAMDNKGALWVTARKTDDGWCELSFKDSGPGIAPENLEKIFDPLFSTKATGIGFGLSICQMIINKHGGRIEVQSEVGEGAVFIVRFPLIKTNK